MSIGWEGVEGISKMIEVVLNQISLDGMRLVRVISNQTVAEAWMLRCVPGIAREFAEVKCWDTSALSLFYGEAKYPVRGAVEICAEEWIRPRRFAAWRLMPGERASNAIHVLSEWFFAQTHHRAQYAFMRKLPKEVESGVLEVDGLVLLEAEWCLERCVLVGGMA